jgi:hypothetical protein
VCTIFITLATIAYAIIAGRQLISINKQIAIMQGTLDEAKRGGEQSTRQMWSAIDNINWMARSMDWNQKSTKQAMDDEVAKLNLQATELSESVQQASRLAAATERANANVVVADRPWIGGHIEVTNFDVGKIPTIAAVFTNSGKRPARIDIAVERSGWYNFFPFDPDSQSWFRKFGHGFKWRFCSSTA